MSDDMELKRLRMEKMQAILKAKAQAQQKSQQKIPTLADKIDMLIKVLLLPDALNYLQAIKGKSPQVYEGIRRELFPAEVVNEIDLLMQYMQQGMIRRGVVSLVDIQYLERQILGIGPSITIKKQGEDAKTLGSYLKNDE